jgi:hypothetical protein
MNSQTHTVLAKISKLAALAAVAAVITVAAAIPLHATPNAIPNNDTTKPAAKSAPPPAAERAVVTYHYDNLRTGWNQNETQLTPTAVASSSFGLLASATLDDQVDTEPLLVPNVTITAGANQGVHDVVYVATEHNTIFAIDAASGAILLSQNFGPPVPYTALPGQCNNNGNYVGIDGTPVIDLSTNSLYVITYTFVNRTQAYYIHDLNLGNLTDQVPPVLITASATLTDGSTYNFMAAVQRQRPAMIEANGNIYAGFGSFCDISANLSRGWLLGWTAGTLAPLPANKLNNTLATSPDDFFLSSIWMSGYGISADSAGNLYFVTGNSDYSGTTYTGTTNIQESVVKISSDLTTVLSLFTPFDQGSLDNNDTDFGSGGVLLVPAGSRTLAAAVGKEGNLFLMNTNNLGGYTPPPGPNKVLDTVSVGSCWCGPSYFTGSDGVSRIVSSGGGNAEVWKVIIGNSVSLQQESTSPGSINNGSVHDPGFFTSISSNGTVADSGIIWAVSRANSSNPTGIGLYAYSAVPPTGQSVLTKLFSAPAGAWTSLGGNSNVVPMVANGKVYVASYRKLTIFGLSAGPKTK